MTKRPTFLALLAFTLCGMALLTQHTTAAPDPADKAVRLTTSTSFPLGPMEELPTVRKNLIELCDQVRIAHTSESMEKMISDAVDSVEIRETLLKEANEWLKKKNATFRKKLRDAAGLASTECFAGLQRQTPESATVKALVTRPTEGSSKYSWELQGFDGDKTVSFSIKRPVSMEETLRLEADEGKTVIELPLKWEGEVSITAKLETKCSDKVYGAINSPQTHVHVERLCSPELNVFIHCERPMFTTAEKKEKAAELVTITGKFTEKWSLGTAGNYSTGKYVVPLKAGESLSLDKVPAGKPD